MKFTGITETRYRFEAFDEGELVGQLEKSVSDPHWQEMYNIWRLEFADYLVRQEFVATTKGLAL